MLSAAIARNVANLYQAAYGRMWSQSSFAKEQQRTQEREAKKRDEEARFQAALQADADERLEALRRLVGRDHG